MKNKRIKDVKKTGNRRCSIIFKIIKCLFPGLAVTAVGFLFLAYLYSRDSGNNKLLYYAMYAAVGLGAFVTGFASFSLFKGRGILAGALGGIPFAFILIAAALIILKGELSLFILVIIPDSVVLSSIGGIVSSNWSAKM